MSVLRRTDPNRGNQRIDGTPNFRDIVESEVFRAHLKSLTPARWGVIIKVPRSDLHEERLQFFSLELQKLRDSDQWDLFGAVGESIERLKTSLDSVKKSLNQASVSREIPEVEGEISAADSSSKALNKNQVSEWESQICGEIGKAVGERFEKDILPSINQILSLGASESGEQIIEFAELENQLRELSYIVSSGQLTSVESISELVEKIISVKTLVSELIDRLDECLEELIHLEDSKPDDALKVADPSDFDQVLTEFFDSLSSRIPNTRTQLVVLAEIFYRSCKLFTGDQTTVTSSQKELRRLLGHLEKLSYTEEDLDIILRLSWHSLAEIIAKSCAQHRQVVLARTSMIAALCYSICVGISDKLRSSSPSQLGDALGLVDSGIRYGVVMLDPRNKDSEGTTTQSTVNAPVGFEKRFQDVIIRIVRSQAIKLTEEEKKCLLQVIETAFPDKLRANISTDEILESVILLVDDIVGVLKGKKVENQRIEKLLYNTQFWATVTVAALVIQNSARGREFENSLIEVVCDAAFKSLNSENQSFEIQPDIVFEFTALWDEKLGNNINFN